MMLWAAAGRATKVSKCGSLVPGGWALKRRSVTDSTDLQLPIGAALALLKQNDRLPGGELGGP